MRWILPAAIALVLLAGGTDNEHSEGGVYRSKHSGVDLRPERYEHKLADFRSSNHGGSPTPTPTPVPVVTPSPVPVPPPVETAYVGAAVSTPNIEAVVPTVVLANEVEQLVCQQGWDCLTALNVMWCESGGKPHAVNGSNYGLFQINSIHAPRFPEFWARWMEPGYNVMMATTIWYNEGWQPWGCRR